MGKGRTGEEVDKGGGLDGRVGGGGVEVRGGGLVGKGGGGGVQESGGGLDGMGGGVRTGEWGGELDGSGGGVGEEELGGGLDGKGGVGGLPKGKGGLSDGRGELPREDWRLADGPESGARVVGLEAEGGEVFVVVVVVVAVVIEVDGCGSLPTSLYIFFFFLMGRAYMGSLLSRRGVSVLAGRGAGDLDTRRLGDLGGFWLCVDGSRRPVEEVESPLSWVMLSMPLEEVSPWAARAAAAATQSSIHRSWRPRTGAATSTER